MTQGALVSALLAVVALAFVLAPLFRRDAAVEERRARNLSEEEGLASEREMAVAALRDLEDDRATGKIGEQDYLEAKERLTARAIVLMRKLDELAEKREHPRPEGVPAPRASGR